MNDWPFADPPSCVAITLRQIVEEGRPVLLALHDADDGCWQFMDGSNDFTVDDGRVVSLGLMFARDPSLGALADLPLGWRAWRADLNARWERAPAEPPD